MAVKYTHAVRTKDLSYAAYNVSVTKHFIYFDNINAWGIPKTITVENTPDVSVVELEVSPC